MCLTFPHRTLILRFAVSEELGREGHEIGRREAVVLDIAGFIRDSLHCLERLWRRLPKPVFESYQPEKNNMRGPGPKRRAIWSSASDVSPSRGSPSSVGNQAHSIQSSAELRRVHGYIGEDYYPLPWSLLTYNPRLEGYEVNITDAQLKGAPKYSTHENWDWGSRARTIDDY